MFSVLLLLLTAKARADACAGKRSNALPPYTKLLTYGEALECMRSIPSHTTWIDSTLNGLKLGLDNFVFLDKMRNSGPPYNIRTNFLEELDKISSKTYQHDLDFQEDLQSLFAEMHDCHTMYLKSMCYHSVFALPFVLRSQVSLGQQRIFIEPAMFIEAYEQFFDIKLERFFGREVVAINGLEVMTFISNFAADNETISNDLSAAFNHALRTSVFRVMRIFPHPSQPSVSFTLGEVNQTEGNLETIELPWLAFGDDNLGEASACIAKKSAALPAPIPDYLWPRRHHGELAKKCETWPDPEFCQFARSVPSPAGHAGAISQRADVTPILPDGQPSTISCFTKRGTQGTTLLMKIRTFEPTSKTSEDPLKGFTDDALKCLQTPFDFVVLDMMQNLGGTIELAFKLLQILVEKYWHEPTKALYAYDIKQSPFMDAFISKTQSVSPLPGADGIPILDPTTLKPFNSSAWYQEPVQRIRGGVLGNYSKKFFMDFSNLFQYRSSEHAFKFPKKSELVVLTDGTCGSTCATFVINLNENDLATTMGVGGISQYTMAVSSFAGGSVSNLKVFEQLGNMIGVTVPQFLTSATWQWTWLELYSKIYPNDAVQFVMQNPTLRLPWWDFPSPMKANSLITKQLSELYDIAMAELEQLNPNSFALSFV